MLGFCSRVELVFRLGQGFVKFENFSWGEVYGWRWGLGKGRFLDGVVVEDWVQAAFLVGRLDQDVSHGFRNWGFGWY